MCLQVKVINRLLAACSVKPEKCAVKIEKQSPSADPKPISSDKQLKACTICQQNV